MLSFLLFLFFPFWIGDLKGDTSQSKGCTSQGSNWKGWWKQKVNFHTLSTSKTFYNPIHMGRQHQLLSFRDATIIDFVGTIIVWGIITVSQLLCIYSFHNIKSHKHSLDIKVLFIAAFWNRTNTVTNNTAQIITLKKIKVHLFYWNEKKVTSTL